ncbi:MAG: AAA family ATPase [Bacilli bacterium]|nr:AAA family ATPase [Bacilli bacterium]MDD4077905.1 AAA family ATPase [Bacilli bacterium]
MLVLIGPSASGKTEIAKILIYKYEMEKLITYTTRMIRPSEKNGIDYHFVTFSNFRAMEEADEFIETTYYNNNFYGSRKKDIVLNKVAVLDPNGLNHLYRHLGEAIVTVYLETPEGIRIERMQKRGDSEDDIGRRIQNDNILFNKANILKIDRVVRNEKIDLEQLAADIYHFYREKANFLIL